MADISNSSWSEVDNSNNQPAPNGLPEGMPPSSVNDSGRANMGGIKRFWNRANATVTTTGSAGTYAYATANTSYPAAYANGEKFAWKAHQDSEGNDLFKVNSLASIKIYKPGASGPAQIGAAEIQADNIIEGYVDTSLDTGSGGFMVTGGVFQSSYTDPMTTRGDLPYRNASNVTDRLAIGTTGQVPTSNGTDLAYADIPLPRDYFSGFKLSNNGSDANNDVDVAAGAARDTTNAANIILASALTKRLDANWAVGTNQGGLDTGSEANSTWYHVWGIKRPDTGVVDALFSLSASAPTMPTNYTLKAYVGAVYNDGSGNLKAFSQYGNSVLWKDRVQSYNATNPGTSAVLQALLTPLGIKTIADVEVRLRNVTTSNLVGLLTSPDANDQTPSNSADPWYNFGTHTGSTIGTAWSIPTRTDTSSRVRFKLSASGASDEVSLVTKGWTYVRGGA